MTSVEEDHPPEPPSLRVAIAAPDPVRRRGLQSIVREAGHLVAAAGEESDIVLADGEAAAADRTKVVALGATDRGQAGLLPRDATPEQIAAALRAVATGLVVRGSELPSRGFAALADTPSHLLSPREVEILALIGDGLSNKAVARRLGISGHTVKFHVESLFRKLGAASRAEAVHKGLRQRLIEL